MFIEVSVIFLLVFVVAYALYVIYYAVDLYRFNPFVKTKPLTQNEQAFIGKYFPVYLEFSSKQRAKCNERIVWFRSKKNFVFHGAIDGQEELKLLLSATAVMLTLGLKQFRMLRSIIRIVVYPTQYYSKINNQNHWGEYNPRYKTVLFSADKIWEGFDDLVDNKNLAMHEFAHALSFEMHKNTSWEARKFRVGLRNIKSLFEEEDFIIKLAASKYFREYGLTNLQEFFSVAVENYFETPSIFKNDFPVLFEEIKRMLQTDFEYNKSQGTFRTSIES